MLAKDVSLIEIDGAHLANWFGLLVPPRVRHGARWAVVFLDGERPIKVVVAGADGPGAVAPDAVPFAGTSARALRKLARALEVDAVIALDRDTMPALHREIDRGLSIDDDFAAQCALVWRVLKRFHERGLWTEPRVLDLAPVVSYSALQRTFDLLVPDDSALVAYAIEDDASDVYSSVIAVKRHGDIALATTHQAIEDVISSRDLARDWRGGHKRLIRAVEDRFARPSLAVVFQRRTFYRVMTGPPDQLAREINARNVIIDPAPAWLLGLLSGATMAALATRGARALAGFLPPSARKMASDLAHTAQTVIRDAGAHPFALLGFDPIELWHNIRHFYQPVVDVEGVG